MVFVLLYLILYIIHYYILYYYILYIISYIYSPFLLFFSFPIIPIISHPSLLFQSPLFPFFSLSFLYLSPIHSIRVGSSIYLFMFPSFRLLRCVGLKYVFVFGCVSCWCWTCGVILCYTIILLYYYILYYIISYITLFISPLPLSSHPLLFFSSIPPLSLPTFLLSFPTSFKVYVSVLPYVYLYLLLLQQSQPRMFYRSGWLRCESLISMWCWCLCFVLVWCVGLSGY